MHIPESMVIKKTRFWVLNHRVNSALPGYLIMSSLITAQQLHDLPEASLIEMSKLMAETEKALQDILSPNHVYIGRYGHTPDLAIHFHFIPVCPWVIDLFWQDQRYRTLQQFGTDSPQTATDGAELTLFIWREFCERKDPPHHYGPARDEVTALLKSRLS